MNKQLLTTAALAALTLVSADAGNVLVANYNPDPLRVLPVVAPGTTTLATAGIAAVGSFSVADPTSLIANAGTPAGYAALLAEFNQFGSVSVGGDVPGLFGGDTSRAVSEAANDPFNAKSIYTIVGNGATLQASTHIAIVRDNDSFGFDNPTFERTADISDPTSALLFGTSGPGIDTALGMSAASLQLAPIPEPMSAVLFLGGAALGLRRRRR